MCDDIALAYCAGIIDGEGYIGIKRTKAYRCQDRSTPGYNARIAVKMTTPQAIQFLTETFGGFSWTEKSSLAKGRSYFVYQATDKKAADILRLLLPFLRVKREMAETVLRLRDLQAGSAAHRTKDTGRTRNFANRYGTIRVVHIKCFSDDYVAACDALYERCKELNQRGIR